MLKRTLHLRVVAALVAVSLLIPLSIRLRAAITVVQSLTFTASGTTPATGTFGSAVTAGNQILVGAMVVGQFSTAVLADGDVTDTLSNPYVKDIATAPGVRVVGCLSTLNSAGGTPTITITNAAGGFALGTMGFAIEVSGLLTSGAYDVGVAPASQGTGTAATGNLSGTTAQADEIEVALIMRSAENISIAVDTASPTYTEVGERLAADEVAGEMDYRVLSGTTNTGAAWTTGTNFDYTVAACTYKMAAAGGSLPPTLGLLGVGR